MISALFAAALVSATCDLEKPSGAPGCTRAAVDALKMNALQTVGSHNSYKMAIAPQEMANLRRSNPKAADTLDYSHEPLTQQLDDGARQLELDFVYDPQGGRYLTPLGRKMAPDTTPYDLTSMSRPGMKVIHVPDIDYRSVCPLFTDCLKEVRAWSKAHPDHVPILIIFNLKQDQIRVPGAVPLLPGARAVAYPGHYPGHLGVEIASVTARALLIADAAPHPALLDECGWHFKYDYDAPLASETRAALVDSVVDTDTLVVCGHYPGGIGRVVRRDGRVLWEPV